ncbi:MAG: saccharopine dehydrogenase NADP-binding domain-containing protein [Chitinophagales bacterium]|nr:saccharopine dehydrogenase NADP-binding domain-containing protein [Chitinophagaceae bacterium]MCB9065931.1 saccharopine dehydrogenase NADP-binding domain-containing protein [Chitinophagales bacterium]
MQTALVVGAGKTSVYLIEYLLKHAPRNKWNIIVADSNMDAIADKIGDDSYAEAVVLDITDNKQRASLVKRADIVISLMPPQLHHILAEDCLTHKKHLITASYVSPEMKALHEKAKQAGLMFMCEMGLDPGIDHMTAHSIINSIHKVAGSIIGFQSYAGGLIAPESDNNPWHYKFTWNPYNVVTAGNAGAKYLYKGKVVEIPYESVFANPGKGSKIQDVGQMMCYPNRDSLKYLELYDLPDVKTFIRGTYRYKGFIRAWNIIVHLGLTDTSDTVSAKTYAEWVRLKNNFDETSLKTQIADKMGITIDDKSITMIEWLGILYDEPITSNKRNSADILLDVLLRKWELKPRDRDMVIMVNEVEYEHKNNGKTKLRSTMVLKGENNKYSAMAKTVGLPMGILAKLILTKKVVPPTGVHIPNMQSIYKPVLAELEEHGIVFHEEVT